MARNAVEKDQLDDFVAEIETGGRDPHGWQGKLIVTIAFVWALFQLYIASNLPFYLADITGLSVLVVTNSDARLIHLAFGLFLAALAFPLFKSSPRDRIPWYDWALAIIGVTCCLYIAFFRNEIAVRAGLPTTSDLIISATGMIVLGITVYRTLGLPLLIIGLVFVSYVFFGNSEVLPEAIQWKGASFGKAMWHFWMQNEGVFGVALGVSASLIFLFVLFGSILEKAGAGNYFIKIAFALLGHYRGGPAKAAVVASAMSGLYSGSSIANTVTTGTFTIPLMKRTGFSAEKAGAIEVASSTNGQLTPPVMGAAAFLIAEFTGISYTEILKHALVPALVSYIALVYIVHLEACKMDLKGLSRPPSSVTLASKAMGFLFGFILLALLTGAVYFGLGWIKTSMPEQAFTIVACGAALAYLLLLFQASRHPDLTVDDPDAPITELPEAGATAITGLYYILPIVILIWCIVVERLSPGLSAFWATVAMIIITITQNPIKSLFRGTGNYVQHFKTGIIDFKNGMIAGSRNMIGISVATGVAGIIVGTISLTGAHQVVGEFVEFLSGGSLIIMLILVAIMSLILGMGLPTTANYIVVSSLMAPVILTLGAKSGLIVPLIAVHLFVFYFGILADDTPPVGLAAFAASAISGGDPIKTGIQGFAYDIRTALLPFLFIFNTELLLIDVSIAKAIFVFFVAVLAMLLFASATQGYMFTRNRLWESAALLLVAFTLFRPGYWLDRIAPPYDIIQPSKVYEVVGETTPNGVITMVVSGPDFDTGEITSTTILVPLGGSSMDDAAERLRQAGLDVTIEDGQTRIDEPFPGTPFFETIGKSFDFYGDESVQIAEVKTPAQRMPKEVFYIPALLLLALVVWLQRRRAAKQALA
ncbi:C4-dicarboxylate ABC transporter [Chromatiales bacterium (ex Bugula neritina AB1)]|nr:C4-dicarboxylate ABC transporter [Chromatiales bacterium (ex Bugula neritina AB1)]